LTTVWAETSGLTSTVNVMSGKFAPAAKTVLVVHVTVRMSHAQPEPDIATAVNTGKIPFDGRASTTVICPDVGAVPELLTVMVYTPPPPIEKVVGTWNFVMASTGTYGWIVVASFAVLLLALPPPDAVAEFVTEAGALAATSTSSVIGG